AARGDEPTRPTAPASEANPAVPAAGHSVHGEAFNDGPRQKAYLMAGQGKADFPVTTSKAEAQAFINQGVAQLHSFFYFEVERAQAMHPGVHHYRIHLWDGVKPARAEKSAGLFGPAAPGIAHAWHMPGHTYTGLKRYADAAYQQEASARVDHAYMARDRVMPFEIHNYAHNNQWLVTSYSHIGRVHDAIAVARNLVEQPRDPNKNGKNDGGSP